MLEGLTTANVLSSSCLIRTDSLTTRTEALVTRLKMSLENFCIVLVILFFGQPSPCLPVSSGSSALLIHSQSLTFSPIPLSLLLLMSYLCEPGVPNFL
ncbi:unnamed protein product [Linum tenue]|uniref:Uncharacterized protein n=1 Tax=Linum tenue TaxID=586396 RepID=A0AAV0IM42_9ROSI|nr:unnamed protein product [Linum tenue]